MTPGENDAPVHSDSLPPELERRLTILEDPANQGAEFDAVSWMWLIVLGVLLPAAVLVWGRW